jgi:hypothetical protein
VPIEKAVEHPSEKAEDSAENAADNACKGSKDRTDDTDYDAERAADKSKGYRKHNNADQNNENGADGLGYHSRNSFDLEISKPIPVYQNAVSSLILKKNPGKSGAFVQICTASCSHSKKDILLCR